MSANEERLIGRATGLQRPKKLTGNDNLLNGLDSAHLAQKTSELYIKTLVAPYQQKGFVYLSNPFC